MIVLEIEALDVRPRERRRQRAAKHVVLEDSTSDGLSGGVVC